MKRRSVSPLITVAVFIGLAVSLLMGLEDDEALAAEPRNMTIGFLLKTMQEERYSTDKSLFIAKAEALGAEVLFDSSANNELTQLQQFEKMLEDGARLIVLQPVNTGTAGALVKLAHDKGVKVVGYDSMLVNGPLDVMVMQDSWAVGRLQGEAMLDWFKAKKGKVEGTVALIEGQPGDSNAEALSSGALTIINDQPGLELISQRSHVNWSPDAARETAETLLIKYDNKVDAFICNNSGLASGVIAALQAEGLADADKVFVAGADADLQNVRYVAEGKQAVEVWKKIKPLAYQAAETAVLLLQNPDKPVSELVTGARMINNGFMEVPTLVTPVVLITKENIDQTLIAGKFFTREQVYGE